MKYLYSIRLRLKSSGDEFFYFPIEEEAKEMLKLAHDAMYNAEFLKIGCNSHGTEENPNAPYPVCVIRGEDIMSCTLARQEKHGE